MSENYLKYELLKIMGPTYLNFSKRLQKDSCKNAHNNALHGTRQNFTQKCFEPLYLCNTFE